MKRSDQANTSIMVCMSFQDDLIYDLSVNNLSPKILLPGLLNVFRVDDVWVFGHNRTSYSDETAICVQS